jgi:flagellar hook assembly protein FlgD
VIPSEGRYPALPIVVRTLLIVGLLTALVATTAASAAPRKRHDVLSSATSELMPGVTYTREVDLTAAGPVVLDVVTAPKPDGTVYSLAPVLSKGGFSGTQTLTRMGRGLRARATTVGVDGDYTTTSGQPSSILMESGALENQPNVGRTSLGITADGMLEAAKVSFYGTWQATAGQRILTLNSGRGHFTLFTPAYGGSTPLETGSVAEAVFSWFPAAQASKDLTGTVAQVTSAGGTPIPKGGAVLVARGSDYVTQLSNEAPVGGKVTVHLTLTPDWSGNASAIGGGPLLVEDGKALFANGEAFPTGTLQSRSARGAVGQLADGRIVLVSVEAGTPEYSVGITSYSLALELVKLGAVTAVGLGSGPQAGMAFDGSLLTRPSTGVEKGIADALVLSYTGVYAPPVAPVLSPNGDGVGDTEALSYRLVRPATVTATLNGPNGATVSIPAGAQPKGSHTFAWDGTSASVPQAEGAWTFSVSATDDRSVTTTAERTFTLDKTLGSLTVSGRRIPTARFVLSRKANVVVRVERRSGVAVKTFNLPHLVAGAHHVSWKGKGVGKYLMRVDATSAIGTSSLVAPFSLR